MEHRLFEANPDPKKPKFFLTAAFPYPNGPVHMGHARTYTIPDVLARFKRMQGYNVLFPMGFHYTGTPIIAIADAIARGEKSWINLFVNVFGVPKEELEKFKEPLYMARYFHEVSKISMIDAGYSIDWRREFATIDPQFSKFIHWQFQKLKEKGFIVQGTHPVGWCPRDKMPVSMHDTKDDVEPEIGEFVLLYFKDKDGVIYPAATLRPETVFGAINVWVNPNATYVKAKVDNEIWVISEDTAYRLTFQLRKVEVIEKFKGEKLLGLRLRNPVTGEYVPVLPATFVDPKMGTGIVMSVPAHAPYDYAALMDLKPSDLSKYNVKPEELKPRPLIKVKGYSDIPAKDVIEKLEVKSQEDREKLDEATKEVYGAEFKYGVMRDDIIQYVAKDIPEPARSYIIGFVKSWIVGKPVSEARENIAKWLEASGLASRMYEIMNKPVYCRCGAEVVVKILEDQWFIDYGIEEWKQLAREALKQMRIVPEEYRSNFEYTIEWIKRRACARTRGLGTKLPWVDGWIIESLSDSTIYMAYYTIAHKIKEYKLKPEQLTYEFWNYVMLGEGDVNQVSKKTGIPVKILKELRNEFDYWYPLDSRHSGKDLIPNHLTFFIYNHVAIFPREKWPRQIVVNGWITVGGQKMSKSLGNILPILFVNRKYSPDVVRLSLMITAEVGQDGDFNEELARSVLDHLKRIYDFTQKVKDMICHEKPSKLEDIDIWILNRMQKHIMKVTESLENVRLREAANTIFYIIYDDIKKYMDRVKYHLNIPERKKTIGWVIGKIVNTWIRMMAPYTPHLAEELWQIIGGKGFVSIAPWPKVEEEYLSPEVEVKEEYIERVIHDIDEIIKVIKKKPSKVYIYVAPTEMYEPLQQAIKFVEESKPLKDFIRFMVSTAKDKRRAAEQAKKIYSLALDIPPHIRDILKQVKIDELKALTNALDYIKEKIGVQEIHVYSSIDEKAPDPGKRKHLALPFRPAIYIE